MNSTQHTENELLRMKDEMLEEVRGLKGKSKKKKLLFVAKTTAKVLLIAGGVTTAVFFPHTILLVAIGGAAALFDTGKSSKKDVKKIHDTAAKKKNVLQGLKGVSEELIRKQTRREFLENPTAPPLYPPLEIEKN